MLAIGYIRISTRLKRQDEQALTKQASKIREACLSAGFDLNHIYEDIGSACSADSLKRRKGLRDALRSASSQKAVIVITDPSRLFRHPIEALKVCTAYPHVRFWSVQHRDFLTTDVLQAEVSAAAAEAEATRIGTSKAQIERGFTGPDHEAKLRGSRISLVKRKSRAADRIERLANVLEKYEQWEHLTHDQAAQLFNSHMLLTSQGHEWTKVNVRRDLKAARRILYDRKEVEALLDELERAA